MENMEIISGKSVFVTGGTGFIGSNLVASLIKANVTVIVPYVEIDKRSLFSRENLSSKVTLLPLDITDTKKIITIFKKLHIDYIIHLAAQTLVTQAYKDPYETLETNIMGTINILEAARTISSVQGVIVASSDKAYGKTDKQYSENFPLKGDHPYDVSKSSADLISQAYFKTYNTPVVITRFGNVYGQGDLHFDRIIPGICQAIIQKKTFEIRSDGTYIRDYLFVQDVVDGYLFLLSNMKKVNGQAFNFSSKDTLSVLELMEKTENILGIKIPYKILNVTKNEIHYQHLDDTKIRTLGWSTKHTLEDSLKNVLSWYKEIL